MAQEFKLVLTRGITGEIFILQQQLSRVQRFQHFISHLTLSGICPKI